MDRVHRVLEEGDVREGGVGVDRLYAGGLWTIEALVVTFVHDAVPASDDPVQSPLDVVGRQCGLEALTDLPQLPLSLAILSACFTSS